MTFKIRSADLDEETFKALYKCIYTYWYIYIGPSDTITSDFQHLQAD